MSSETVGGGPPVASWVMRLLDGQGVKLGSDKASWWGWHLNRFLENVVDIRSVQELLGHNSLETTQIHTHVMTSRASSVKSPLEV